MHFAALHESGIGPSRHIAVPRNLGRKRGIAEIDRQPSIEEGDEFDLAAYDFCSAKALFAPSLKRDTVPSNMDTSPRFGCYAKMGRRPSSDQGMIRAMSKLQG